MKLEDNILVIAGWDHVHVSALGSKNISVMRSTSRSAVRMSVPRKVQSILATDREWKMYSLGKARRTAPVLRVVDGRVDANSHCAVGADVVLVGTVLTALGSDALQLLLGRSIGVADLHQVALIANRLAVVALDDLLTHVTTLEAVMRALVDKHSLWRRETYRAKPTLRELPMLSRKILLDMIW